MEHLMGVLNPISITWVCLVSAILMSSGAALARPEGDQWQIGRPIVSYYAGPGHSSPMTEESARQMADGGWNLVWCSEKDLDLVHKHGLRANLIVKSGELSHQNAGNPDVMAKLDELIERVKNHPALYSYWIVDEPNASVFPDIGKLVARIRDRDPKHFAWINLFPTYANNGQLGTKGETVPAYREHLRQFMEIVKPSLISYDNYQFFTRGDGDQYFLNLAIIRDEALKADVPFLNIIQACSWNPNVRVPNPDELRFLTYTSLAYGAQGIAHYVYNYPTRHTGMIVGNEGKPTDLYYAAQKYNPAFERMGSQLMPLTSLGAYHVGSIPRGAEALPDDSPFRIDSPGDKSYLLGYFGKGGAVSHVVVVNLDYKASASPVLIGPGELQTYDPSTDEWSSADDKNVKLDLPPGGGALLRTHAAR